MRIDTKRLASDPGYWHECGAGNYQYAFTTGPEWDGAFEYVGSVEFADEDGRRGSDIWSPRLQIGPKSWTLVAVRPQEDDVGDQEKRILVETFVAGPGRDRIVMVDSERVMRHGGKVEIYLTRAQSPEVEWDKDLPDVGTEKQYYNSEMNEVRECMVIAHRHGCAVVEDQDGQSYEAVPPNNFICTKGQRQRDEIIDEAWTAINQDYSEESTRQTNPQEYVLNAICQLYDAGLLRKPEGD